MGLGGVSRGIGVVDRGVRRLSLPRRMVAGWLAGVGGCGWFLGFLRLWFPPSLG